MAATATNEINNDKELSCQKREKQSKTADLNIGHLNDDKVTTKSVITSKERETHEPLKKTYSEITSRDLNQTGLQDDASPGDTALRIASAHDYVIAYLSASHSDSPLPSSASAKDTASVNSEQKNGTAVFAVTPEDLSSKLQLSGIPLASAITSASAQNVTIDPSDCAALGPHQNNAILEEKTIRRICCVSRPTQQFSLEGFPTPRTLEVGRQKNEEAEMRSKMKELEVEEKMEEEKVERSSR